MKTIAFWAVGGSSKCHGFHGFRPRTRSIPKISDQNPNEHHHPNVNLAILLSSIDDRKHFGNFNTAANRL